MDWTIFESIANHILQGLPLFASAVIVLVIARCVFMETTSFNANDELFEKRNPAYAVALGGYLLGAGLALSGAFFGGREEDSLTAAGMLLADGLLAVALLRLSVLINDRFILHSFRIDKEISEDRNLGVGFCLAGSSVACGTILNGAMTGHSEGFVLGLRDTVLFWALAQAALVAACAAYRKTMKYDVHRLIEYDDNTAVGIGFGGFLVGMGIVLRSTLVHAGKGPLGQEIAISAVLAIFGAALLVAVNSLTLRLLFPRNSYEEEFEMQGNVGVAAIAACVTISVALFLASIVQRIPSP
jgi:uncharacterized membrane protein YjfL (UPF0719 family)